MFEQKFQNKIMQNEFSKRFSLNEKHQKKLTIQRQQLRNKYYQFLQTKRRHLQQYPFSPQTIEFDQNAEIKKSMPSIRLIRKQKNEIGEALHRTIAKYNYQNQQKNRKLQILNLKKLKYEKILKIREENKKEKYQLNSSKLQHLKEYHEEKMKLKKMVELDQLLISQSRFRMESEKKNSGVERRQQLNRNKYKILSNKSKVMQQNRRLHECISQQQYELKLKKKLIQTEKLNASQTTLLSKLNKQIDEVTKFEMDSNQTITKYESKIQQLQKSNIQLSQQLKNYDELLLNNNSNNTICANKPFFKVRTAVKEYQRKRCRTCNFQSLVFE